LVWKRLKMDKLSRLFIWSTHFLIFIHFMKKSLLYHIFIAWKNLRYNKSTKSIVAFELKHEKRLLELTKELENKSYRISPYRCFIIYDPVQREIFAAHVRDRVVHHLLYSIISPFFEKIFIYDNYACRVGKWTHFGVNRIDKQIRSCSQNYQQDCHILKLDIKWYFMAIDKQILEKLLLKEIEKYKDDRNKQYPYLSYDYGKKLLKDIIYHDPTQDYARIWSIDDRSWLPPDKSLFHSPPWVWLPIGNLTSQLFANVYLHELDVYIKRTLKIRYYWRYMDDFVLVHPDKEYLQSCIKSIRNFLDKKLNLTLHPKKIYLQHYSKWVPFCGAVIKPYRTYIQKKTLWRWQQKINKITAKDVNSYEKLQKVIAMINSYLGMIKHHSSYKIRKKVLQWLPPFLANKIICKNEYTKIIPRTRRLRKAEIKSRKKRRYF